MVNCETERRVVQFIIGRLGGSSNGNDGDYDGKLDTSV